MGGALFYPARNIADYFLLLCNKEPYRFALDSFLRPLDPALFRIVRQLVEHVIIQSSMLLNKVLMQLAQPVQVCFFGLADLHEFMEVNRVAVYVHHASMKARFVHAVCVAVTPAASFFRAASRGSPPRPALFSGRAGTAQCRRLTDYKLQAPLAST